MINKIHNTINFRHNPMISKRAAASDAAAQILFPPLEPKISRTLKAELSAVALDEQTIFAARERKLHAVAALNLKGDVTDVKTVVSVNSGPHMLRINPNALRNDTRGNGQARRIVVAVPFRNSGDDGIYDHTADQKKHEYE